MHKKGIAGSLIVEVFSIFLIILIVVVYYFIFDYAQGYTQKQSITAERASKGQVILLNYLRMPIIFENKNMNMADLISVYYSTKDQDLRKKYADLIREETKNHLTKIEYCERYPGRISFNKYIRGYFIYITNDPENSPGLKWNDFVHFSSENFGFASEISKINEQILPTLNLENFWVILYESNEGPSCKV